MSHRDPKAAPCRVLVVGVGGQGALTAAKFLGAASMAAGRSAVVGQLHGMSQRGGSVEASVIIGESHSSFIGYREADVVLGLEPLEALRALPKCAATTELVVNTGHIVPFSLSTQGGSYPPVGEILQRIRGVSERLCAVDGPALVKRTGVPRTLNVVMLGALAARGVLPFEGEFLWRAVEQGSPPRFVEANRQAFELGRAAASEGGVP